MILLQEISTGMDWHSVGDGAVAFIVALTSFLNHNKGKNRDGRTERALSALRHDLSLISQDLNDLTLDFTDLRAELRGRGRVEAPPTRDRGKRP